MGDCSGGMELTADTFRKKWLGLDERPYHLLEVFKQHNHQLEQLVGTNCSKATFSKYRTAYDHTTNFIRWKYQGK